MKYTTWLTTPGQLMDEVSQKQGTANNALSNNAGYIWQRSLRSALLVVVVAGLSACASNYTIKATDGTVYHTQGAPSLVGGTYRFIDSAGNAQQVYLSNVSQVEKR